MQTCFFIAQVKCLKTKRTLPAMAISKDVQSSSLRKSMVNWRKSANQWLGILYMNCYTKMICATIKSKPVKYKIIRCRVNLSSIHWQWGRLASQGTCILLALTSSSSCLQCLAFSCSHLSGCPGDYTDIRCFIVPYHLGVCDCFHRCLSRDSKIATVPVFTLH